MKKMNKKGFTIVELVIVIAVIGILATVLIPTFGNVIKNAQDESFRLAARNAFVEHTATTPADLTADFIYVDGDKYAVINDGKLDTTTDDKGNVVVKIYDSEAAALEAFKHEITKEDNKTYVVTFAMGGNVAGTKLYNLGAATETEKTT